MNDEYIEIEGCIASFNHLDNQGEILIDCCNLDIANPVIVSLDWSKKPEDLMGEAYVEKRPDGLWAKMKIKMPDSDPHRWEIIQHLKPCMGGHVVSKERVQLLCKSECGSGMVDFRLLTGVSVNEIGLSYGNVDHSILSLKDMYRKSLK